MFVEELASLSSVNGNMKKELLTYSCFVDRKFLEISREFESRDCIKFSSICTIAPTFIGPTTMKFPVLRHLKQKKIEDIFVRSYKRRYPQE